MLFTKEICKVLNNYKVTSKVVDGYYLASCINNIFYHEAL